MRAWQGDPYSNALPRDGGKTANLTGRAPVRRRACPWICASGSGRCDRRGTPGTDTGSGPGSWPWRMTSTANARVLPADAAPRWGCALRADRHEKTPSSPRPGTSGVGPWYHPCLPGPRGPRPWLHGAMGSMAAVENGASRDASAL